MNRQILPAILCAMVALCSLPAARAAADVTGLVPTIWWDFETKPSSAGTLKSANKGSISMSFTAVGDWTYQPGVTNGWALDTSACTAYAAAGSYSTKGSPITVSAVMTLGTNPNGITLNVRTTTGDLILRRGDTAGSLVVGWGAQQQASSHTLTATFTDGDAAYHLVSVVGTSTGTELYVDGVLAGSSTEFTPWSASGKVTQMQFGSHLNVGAAGDEARLGGLIDDLRIHDAALTPLQIRAIAQEFGLFDPDFIGVAVTGGATVGKDSLAPSWKLDVGEGRSAAARLVYGTDAELSSPATNVLGMALSAGEYTASLSELEPDTTYWLKIVASNGVNWAETPLASFHTKGTPVFGDATATATEQSAAFSVALAEAAMENTLTTSVSVFYGTNGVDWTESPLGSASSSETFSGTIENLGYGVTYQWFARATATMEGGRVLSDSTATNSFTTLWNGDMYVDAASTSASKPYNTSGTAAKTISAAISAATVGATIHVAPGLYSVSTPIAVNKAICISGDDPDPSRVVVSNTANAGSGGGNKRVFTLNHANALVANLTMQNGMSWGTSGSCFLIDSNGGMVSNCVVEAGLTKGNSAHSGGAVLKAGCVSHTIFRKCKVGSNTSSDSSHKNLPAVLELTGNSIAQDCLFADNTQDKSKALVLIRIGDSSQMRNCTIVDSGLGSTNGACTVFSALYINSANATAQNVVIAGVTNLIDGAACRPSGTISHFFNGAVDADISGLTFPDGTIVGTAESFFNDYASGDYTLNPTSLLVNAGINYEGMASVDLAGNPRKVGSRIDIGCYELRSTPLIIIVR